MEYYRSPGYYPGYASYNSKDPGNNTGLFLVIIVIVVIILFGMWWANRKTYRAYYNVDNPVINQIRQNFAKLKPEYGNVPIREGDSSYTEGKKFITLCLRDPATGKYYDMNTIMYVALHELAHLVSESYGSPGNEHNDEFKKNFQVILDRAERLGFYNPNIPMPKTYCGIDH